MRSFEQQLRVALRHRFDKLGPQIIHGIMLDAGTNEIDALRSRIISETVGVVTQHVHSKVAEVRRRDAKDARRAQHCGQAPSPKRDAKNARALRQEAMREYRREEQIIRRSWRAENAVLESKSCKAQARSSSAYP